MTQYNVPRVSISARVVLLALAAVAVLSSGATAQTAVGLIAAPAAKVIALPNGGSTSVPVWAFALDGEDRNFNGVLDAGEDLNGNGILDGPNGVLDAGETPSVPGPRITVPAGTSALTIRLKNLLAEPVSIVIPGQRASGAPVRDAGGRVVSMAPEAAPSGEYTYTFNNLKPGTFLYQSGSHPAVQVQMGLYGALTANLADATASAPAQAYATTAGDDYRGVPFIGVEFLLRNGFTVVRPHPDVPLLRVDLKSLVSWTENLEAVLESLRLPMRVPKHAPATLSTRRGEQ